MYTASATISKLLYITQSRNVALCLSTPKHNGNSGTVIIHEYEECVFPNDSRARDDSYRDAEIY